MQLSSRPFLACGLALGLLSSPWLAAQTSVPAAGATTSAAKSNQLKPGDVAPEFTVTGPKG